MNLASGEIVEKNIEKAKEYNKAALEIFTEFKDPYSIVSCLAVDADILISEKKYKEAVKDMVLSLELIDTELVAKAKKTTIEMAE